MFSDPRFLVQRAGVTLLLLLLAALLLNRIGVSASVVLGLLGLGAVLAIPVMGQTLFAWGFGIFGPLSGGFFVLAGTVLWNLSIGKQAGFTTIDILLPLALTQIVLAVWLYPCSLGWLMIDSYRIGYQPDKAGIVLVFVGILLGIGEALFDFGGILGLWLVISGCIFAGRLHPSRNLWDSLVDPVAVLCSIGIVSAALPRLF